MKRIDALDNLKVEGLRVLVRVDLNVPIQDNRILDTTRIERLIPTLKELAAKKARVIILSHFGRPGGHPNPKESLKQVCPALSLALGMDVRFIPSLEPDEIQSAVQELKDGQIALLENLRFYPGEEMDDDAFAQDLARLGDLYVNDAFSASHRAHASVHAIAKYLPSVAGRLMQAEIEALTHALENPKHPIIALVGGAKVSTKLEILKNLVKKVDILVVGGGMANTFLFAEGIAIGKSLCEKGMVETVESIKRTAQISGCEIILPKDAVIAENLQSPTTIQVCDIADVPDNAMIFDIGPKTVAAIEQALKKAHTCIWNGPMGVFEAAPFDRGTTTLIRQVASLTQAHACYSIAGGGETVAALAHAGCADQFSYVSTAGGAFLEWLEGKALPGLTALERSSLV